MNRTHLRPTEETMQPTAAALTEAPETTST
ncbi:MAG: hypothetical protein QOF96_1295, partial [Actinomycetota bacterium]|nr:hypothetical protein [Actinomycetota bacterium]